jgi:hypothetical protein
MNYDLSLKSVGLVVGLLLIAGHGAALAKGAETRRWLAAFPRSYKAGAVLLTIDWLWTEVLAFEMDWGEFYYLQKWILLALPICFFLTLKFVDDYLAVRALGILALLAAAPLLDAAFLQPPQSRLILVVLAYVWIVLGMLWVGQPHLLRDQIGWVQRSALRWQIASAGGVAYGLLLLVCALAWY